MFILESYCVFQIKGNNISLDKSCICKVETPLNHKCSENLTIFTFSREQMNFGTAYLDGSGIYGATPESADKLREFDGGFLKVILVHYFSYHTLCCWNSCHNNVCN